MKLFLPLIHLHVTFATKACYSRYNSIAVSLPMLAQPEALKDLADLYHFCYHKEIFTFNLLHYILYLLILQLCQLLAKFFVLFHGNVLVSRMHQKCTHYILNTN